MDVAAWPILVVNLARSADRRAHIVAQLETEWQHHWEILPAVDGLGLDIDAFRRLGLIREIAWLGRDLTSGEVGCWLSHLFGLSAVVSRGFHRAIVLEDDVVLARGFQTELTTRLQRLENAGVAWDFCFLGCYEGAGNWAPKKPERLLSGEFFQLDAHTRGTPGTYGYMVSLEGARKLLARMCERPIDVPVDELFPELCTQSLRIICASPPLVEPSGHPSAIAGQTAIHPSRRSTQEFLSVYLACLRRHGVECWWHSTALPGLTTWDAEPLRPGGSWLPSPREEEDPLQQQNTIRFDLGGNGKNGERVSVNLHGESDIHCDIVNVDEYAPEDGTVDEFYLFHTLEHIPVECYTRFMSDLKRKLRPGGKITVIQSDAGEVMRQWTSGQLNFRAMRGTIMTPADRVAGNPFNRHHQMWTAEELCRDFRAFGMRAEEFDAGGWGYDMVDEFYPEDTQVCQGVVIKNLGVAATKLSIPKLIHQTWKTQDIPESLFRPHWIESWRNLTGFEYKLWTDEDNRRLIAEHYPWFLSVYDGYDTHIKRVDAARYFILHRYGGVYADLDFVCLKSLDELLAGRDLLFGYERPGTLGNAIMGGAPEHPALDRLIHKLAHHAHENVLVATGPAFVTRYLETLPWREQFVSAELLYPYPYYESRKDAYREFSTDQLRHEFPAAYAVTHWTGSWL